MKANQFVKKFGWDIAKYLAYRDKTSVGYLFVERHDVCQDDLKRLVESYDLVESYGGIKKAKSDTSLPTCFGDNDFFREVTLKKAIADVEGCL